MLKLRFHFLYLFIVFASFYSCRTVVSADKNIDSKKVKIPVREHSVQAVLWQQLSAEYKALCYQAFNVAKLSLDKTLAEGGAMDKKPLAIITDVDETVLSNSPFNAKMIEDDDEYTREKWVAWGKLEEAMPVPGALDFFKYAASKGVEIYYISNRYNLQLKETMQNLQKIGFPYIDESHILLRTETSGKEARRQAATSDKSVIMLLGDNLSDFSEAFENKSTKDRNNTADSMQQEFGKKFIVLPNPMYGDWETKGLYEGSYKWTASQKDSLRKLKLISY